MSASGTNSNSYLQKPAAAPADGQVLAWSATLGSYTPVNPTGASELAFAANITGTVTSLSASGGAGAIVDIPGCVITVPPSADRSVRVEYAIDATQTAAGLGTIYVLLYETTGTATLLDYAATTLPNQTGAGVNQIPSPRGTFELGVVTSTRTFKLSAYIYAVASNSPTANVTNTAGQSSIIRALAG